MLKQSSQLILAALIRGKAYGLEIAERVSTSTGGKVELGQATLYPTLRELEAGGLVRAWEEPAAQGERGGRPRRYYELTAEGSRAAMEERATVGALWGLLLPKGAS